ncbi:glycosyltransferase [Mesorhizobium sp. RMAD-H1]|uniref:glycosyltransferase n=1 Tax=Mesorhizobium sp. RMAD-H1 TaxID=2587065 RepID=UPI0016132BA6|nr:glycosyltransferase [Mesorhizobium sp. RMAD-H1]MBB2970319.1 glycosyltransferase involved in cell wall biosynthesis [Mesorhizobium sp. RMAD-H1]
MSQSAEKFHVSLILSVHDDAKYLARTIWSFSEAAAYAHRYGVTTELVIVQDNPTASIKAALSACDFGSFANVITIIVSVGSLGPCRQAGIDAASGKYVALSDADDLISYNSIWDMYRLAEELSEKHVLFPEWLVAFGSKHYLYRMFPLFEVNELALFDHHPFISRSFLRREHALQIRLADVPHNGLYAYEDWHHNSNLAAHGFTLMPCPNTVFFYRKKGVSMLSSVNSSSMKTIPYSDFFKPENYLKVCADGRQSYTVGSTPRAPSGLELHDRFFSNRLMIELCSAANFIDPSVNLRYISPADCFSNLKEDLRAGAAYYRICETLQGKIFTDVFLLPYFMIGGAEKVIIDTLEAMLKIDPARKVLLLFGMHTPEHKWLDRLPASVTYCDINRFSDQANDETIDLLTLRTIQTFAPGARIFIKSSSYGYRFYDRYRKLLSGHEAVMLRFCDGAFELDGAPFTVGFDFGFVAEHGDALTVILSDNQHVINLDQARLPFIAGKTKVLYSPSKPLAEASEVEGRYSTLHNRILWASRLDYQKRPELLAPLARAIKERFPGTILEVWGTRVLNAMDLTELEQQENVVLRGEFSSFEDLPYRQSDMFIYTTRFDGIPTVLLSALGAGLPVIAPSIGGIPEIVLHEKTGLVVDASLSDADLIEAYIDAITRLKDSADTRKKMGAAAIELIQKQHSPAHHLESVRSALFGEK